MVFLWLFTESNFQKHDIITTILLKKVSWAMYSLIWDIWTQSQGKRQFITVTFQARASFICSIEERIAWRLKTNPPTHVTILHREKNNKRALVLVCSPLLKLSYNKNNKIKNKRKITHPSFFIQEYSSLWMIWYDFHIFLTEYSSLLKLISHILK